MIFQLTYLSRAIHPLGHISDLDILRKALKRNAPHDLTGYLVRDAKNFLQTLEGSHHEVRALYAKIKRDKRHSEVTTLLQREIPHRMFGNWSMGYSELRSQPLLDAKASVLELAKKNPAEAGRVVDFLRKVAVA